MIGEAIAASIPREAKQEDDPHPRDNAAHHHGKVNDRKNPIKAAKAIHVELLHDPDAEAIAVERDGLRSDFAAPEGGAQLVQAPMRPSLEEFRGETFRMVKTPRHIQYSRFFRRKELCVPHLWSRTAQTCNLVPPRRSRTTGIVAGTLSGT